MAEWCVRHPGDSSRLVPVDDLLAELWARAEKLESAAAEQHAAVLARLDAQQAASATLSNRVTDLESDTRVSTLTARVASLEARVKALEPHSAFGVDVSRHQTAAEVTAAVTQDGYEFVIINATTGLKSISDALDTNTQVARKSGDLTGFYHWSQTVNDLATTPDKSDPIGEARHFVTNSKAKPGDILALDHEEELGTWPQRVAYAVAWLEEVKRLTGATPLLYVNWNWVKGLRTAATAEQWARLVKFPLWLADWSGTPGKHSTVTSKDGTDPDSWPILVHQYAVINDMDRNWTPDITALRALAVK